MTTNKKQHFIPRSYLKAWCDPECPENQSPYVWKFERDERTGRKKSPENIFLETDMYTIFTDIGGRDLSIEHTLSELEGQFVNIRKNKLQKNLALDERERLVVCAFIAALHARTPTERERMQNLWTPTLDMMTLIKEKMKTMTAEELKNLERIGSASDDSKKRISYQDVQRLAKDPLQHHLIPSIQTQIPFLYHFNLAVYNTDSTPGFITSDDPCIWHDPELDNQTPVWIAPALGSETIEVIVPISPNQCVLLGPKGFKGDYNVSLEMVDAINRAIRIKSNQHFIVSKNYTKEVWFQENDPLAK